MLSGTALKQYRKYLNRKSSNLIKKLLYGPEKYNDSFITFLRDIAYVPLELKKKLFQESFAIFD